MFGVWLTIIRDGVRKSEIWCITSIMWVWYGRIDFMSEEPANKITNAKEGRGWREIVFAWLTLGLSGIAVATLFGFGARWNGFAELFVHFKLVYFWGVMVVGIGYAIIGRYRWVAASFLILMIHAPGILYFYVPRGYEMPEDDGSNLTLLTANVLSENTNRDGLISYLEQRKPDIVLIQEISPAWMEALRPLSEELYPYSLFEARFDNFGMAVLSRVPVGSLKLIDPLEFEIPIMEAVLEIGGHRVSILNYHPLPPVSRDYITKRNRQLDYIGEYAAYQDGLVIVAGDLNVTPWSPIYKDAIERSGLVNARQGFGVLPTWPSLGALFPVVPIDHCLVSPDIAVTQVELAPEWGSDHRALWVEMFVLDRN